MITGQINSTRSKNGSIPQKVTPERGAAVIKNFAECVFLRELLTTWLCFIYFMNDA